MNSSVERLFLALPALRNIGATLKGALLNRERYGRYYRETVAGILARDSWTAAQMSEYQNQRLRYMIGIAAHHVPYYRELFRAYGLTARDIQTADDLRKLPILEKNAVRANPLAFVDERLDRQNLLREATTGTTGTPIVVLTQRRVQQRNYAFFEARCRRVAGLRYGKDPYVMFGARHVVPLEHTTPPFWCYNYAAKQLYMSAYHLAPTFLEHYCVELKRRSYVALMGYPSVIATIGRYILDFGIRDIRIPVAITNGEILHPHQRALIEKAFGSHVFNQYGCTELAVFAAEPRCGRMHVSPDYGIVEILDDEGEPAPPDQSGHLVCTGLINDAQIFLRYRVGDTASWDSSSCDCARHSPVLKSLDGRTANALILPDGRRVFRVGTIAEEISCIQECQIVQQDIGVFTIYVVTSGGFTNYHRETLVKNLAANVGHADIRVQLIDRVPRGPGGKFAFIVCRVPGEKLGRVAGVRF